MNLRVSVLGTLFMTVGCDAPEGSQAAKDPSSGKVAASGKPAASGQTLPAGGTAQAKPAKGPFPESTDPTLKDPSKTPGQAPETFSVVFDTTAGAFEIDCTRSFAPNGVDRLYHLVKIGFFDDVAFFRAVKGFMVQFGIHGNPEVSKPWRDARVAPDPVVQSNTRGFVSFAMAGSPDSRTTQLFINFGDNARLDGMGFAPVCKVAGNGMDVVDKIYNGYGEKPSGAQGTIQNQGNAFLRSKFPELDYIKTARLKDGGAAPAASASASAGPSASAPAAPSAVASAGPSAGPSASPAPKR